MKSMNCKASVLLKALGEAPLSEALASEGEALGARQARRRLVPMPLFFFVNSKRKKKKEQNLVGRKEERGRRIKRRMRMRKEMFRWKRK